MQERICTHGIEGTAGKLRTSIDGGNFVQPEILPEGGVTVTGGPRAVALRPMRK